MKHVILLILSTLISINSMYSQSWQTIGSASASVGVANFSTIAMDNDIPYVAFQDGDQGNKVTVKKYVNGAWTTVGNVGFTAGGATYIKLVIYNHTPYVAYSDYGNSRKLSVMKFDGTNWVNVGTAGFSLGQADYIDLIISNNGTPYVAFTDAGNYSYLSVLSFNGSSWQIVGSSRGVSYDTGMYPSMAFDSNGDLHVAYRENDYAGAGCVIKYNGSRWIYLGTMATTDTYISYLSLAFDGTIPYIAYCTGTNSTLSWRKFVNGAWTDLPGVSSSNNAWASLKIRNHIPYIAYVKDYTARLAKFENNTWSTIGDQAIVTHTATYLNFDFKSDGTPVVAFKNSTESNRISTYFYGTTLNTAINETQAESFSFYPNPVKDRMYFKTDDQSIKEILDLNGHVLTKTNSQSIQLTMPAGVYLLKHINANKEIQIQKFIKTN